MFFSLQFRWFIYFLPLQIFCNFGFHFAFFGTFFHIFCVILRFLQIKFNYARQCYNEIDLTKSIIGTAKTASKNTPTTAFINGFNLPSGSKKLIKFSITTHAITAIEIWLKIIFTYPYFLYFCILACASKYSQITLLTTPT